MHGYIESDAEGEEEEGEMLPAEMKIRPETGMLEPGA